MDGNSGDWVWLPGRFKERGEERSLGFSWLATFLWWKVVADSGYVTGRTRVPTGSLPGRSCALADLPHSPAFLPGFAWAPIPLSSVVKFFQNVIPQLREMAKQINKLTWNVWRLLCSQKGWEAVKTKTEQNAFWQPRILSKRDLKCTGFFFLLLWLVSCCSWASFGSIYRTNDLRGNKKNFSKLKASKMRDWANI